MSPGTKKILIGVGVVAVGYLIYDKVIKKPATPFPLLNKLPEQLAAKPAPIDGVDQAIEELGLSQDLGSLGGGYR